MGGHGGLNILPQKKWNVYNWDNRDKVKEDENLVREAIRRKKEEQTASALDSRVAKLKGQEEEVKHEEELKQEEYEDLNVIFEAEREKRKKEDKKTKKQVEKTFQREVGATHHVNLFQAQEMADQMKQKQKDKEKYDTAVKTKEEKYSGTLGSLFVKEKPWYCQMRKEERQTVEEKYKIKEREEKKEYEEHKREKKEKKKEKKEKKREEKRREKEEKRRKKHEKRAEIERLRKERMSREETEKRRKLEVINL